MPSPFSVRRPLLTVVAVAVVAEAAAVSAAAAAVVVPFAAVVAPAAAGFPPVEDDGRDLTVTLVDLHAVIVPVVVGGIAVVADAHLVVG